MNRDRKRLIRALRGSIGEPGTETMVRYVDLTLKENNENMFNAHFETLATKKELGETRKELGETRKELGEFKYEFIQFRGEVKEEFASVRGEMKEEFASVRGEMKEEFANVRGEMKEEFAKVRGEMKEGLASVRGEMKEGFAKLKGDLEVKISDTKTDVARWMFALFVTMLLAILGLYFKKNEPPSLLIYFTSSPPVPKPCIPHYPPVPSAQTSPGEKPKSFPLSSGQKVIHSVRQHQPSLPAQ